MWKTETLEDLFAARDAITRQVITLSPTDDEQRAQLVALMKKRDRITAHIQAIMAASFRPAEFQAIERHARELEEAANRLKAVGDRLDLLNDAVEAADQVVKAAAAIVALAG